MPATPSPSRAIYNTREPPVAAWTELLRDNWRVIKDEFDAFDARFGGLRGWGNAMGRPGWEQITIKLASRESTLLKRWFPETLSLLSKTPVVNALFSVLEPKSAIHLHYGETKTVLRYHLALWVPECPGARDESRDYLAAVRMRARQKERQEHSMHSNSSSHSNNNVTGHERRNQQGPPLHLGVYASLPFNGGFFQTRASPGIRGESPVVAALAGGYAVFAATADVQTRPLKLSWKQGEDLLFDDNFPHYAYSGCNEPRVVLFADVPRYDCGEAAELIFRLGLEYLLPLTEYFGENRAVQARGLHRVTARGGGLNFTRGRMEIRARGRGHMSSRLLRLGISHNFTTLWIGLLLFGFVAIRVSYTYNACDCHGCCALSRHVKIA